MFSLIQSLIRPYRGTLLIILIAMLVQTAMSVADPWPLKVILDNVVGSHKLLPEMTHLLGPLLRGEGKMKIAEAAAIAAVLIALIGASMSYIANCLPATVSMPSCIKFSSARNRRLHPSPQLRNRAAPETGVHRFV